MITEYKEVRLKKKVILTLLGVFAAALTLLLFTRQWGVLYIPGLCLVAICFGIKNDRIIYNDNEVIIVRPPFGKKVCVSWDRIENLEIQHKAKFGRGGWFFDWYLMITYRLENGKTATIEMLYNNYDGASDFVDTYNRINHV